MKHGYEVDRIVGVFLSVLGLCTLIGSLVYINLIDPTTCYTIDNEGVNTMARGAPDYSNVKVGEYSIRLDDMGEMAARLGSPMIYDRGGEVILIDTFQYGLTGWNSEATGTNAAVTLNNAYWQTGGYSAKLMGGSDGTRRGSIYRNLALVNMDSIALEARALIHEDVETVEVDIILYDGTTRYWADLAYTVATDELKVYDENGAMQTISGTVSPNTQSYTFNFIKLVLDWENKRYHKVLFNGFKYDISEYDLKSDADATAPRVQIMVRAISTATKNGFIQVDNVIVTRGEKKDMSD
jgi:hypothetical protein